jgi:hypothetical protein
MNKKASLRAGLFIDGRDGKKFFTALPLACHCTAWRETGHLVGMDSRMRAPVWNI